MPFVDVGIAHCNGDSASRNYGFASIAHRHLALWRFERTHNGYVVWKSSLLNASLLTS